MAADKIIYVSNVYNIKDKLTKVKELFDESTLELVLRDEEVTSEYLYALKARYTELLNEVAIEKTALLKLTPVEELTEEHKQLSKLVNGLYDSTFLATNSVKEKMTRVEVRELVPGIKNQQYCVDDIEKIVNELVEDLTKQK